MDEVWVRSPAWVLQCVAGTGGASAQLLVSGGADETYWVDELASSDGAQRVFEAWQADALHALRDDAACGAAVRQLLKSRELSQAIIFVKSKLGAARQHPISFRAVPAARTYPSDCRPCPARRRRTGR